MPFKQVFERRVNRNMQESEAGPAPANDDEHEKDVKQPNDRKDRDVEEEEDMEISEKKDRPPRFSALFDAPVPPPQIIERYVEPKRRSGVYIPTSLFLVLAFVLFFESTLLFAYTIIGLYNNLPHGILPFGGSSSALVGACDCNGQQSGINFAPNFYMPGIKPEVATMISSATVVGKATSVDSSTTTPTSLPTSTLTHSTTSITGNTAAAAGIMSALLGDQTTTNPAVAVTTKVIVTTPTRKVVTSIVEKTVNAKPQVSTSFVNVPPPSSTNAKRASPASNTASVEDTTTSTDNTTAPTTLKTSASPPQTNEAHTPTTKDETSKTSASSTTTGGGVAGACFGAGGAVFQNCVPP